MEKDDQSTSQVSENSLVHQVHMMKVCVAVACCAIKPKNTPVRTFTEALGTAFHNANRQLQNKQTSLEAELLHLRQQIAMGSMSSQEKSHAQQDVSQADVEVLLPTPPSSGTEMHDVTLVERRDFDSLHRNTQFLQSVINLQQVTRQASELERLNVGDKIATNSEKDYSSLEVKLKSMTNLNHTTIVQSLQTIKRCIQDKTFMVSVKSLQRCIQCIVQLMDRLPDLASNIPIVSLIKDIVKSLVEDILNIQEDSSHTQRNSRQQSIDLVLEFSKPPVTRISQEVMMEEIQRFSQHLQDVCVNGKSLQVSWFENIIFVIQLLQTVLDEYYSSHVTKDRAMLQGLKDKLEDSLLHVTHTFPLYAHSIWNICGQLELQLWKTTSV
ncbi:uncharacterized protein LOC110460271 isoform X1 [Mizuhopecten yessoensis]|uniref:Uncharacterized protein n=1 Tax=Mizuhopecten yessoensis TaxID=6573 RepID=A0A210Q2V2_MIZYE|nr:uncharacterized protein LOC110460271 isoform X1 [Mizuhopecten yessoensis]OWF43070.1 hypothetical protein KP79_PYT01934 [Mizuhopecten yessoensis]